MAGPLKMVAPGSGEPDMTLVAELLEDIQRHPPAVAARTLLAQHYISIGWFDAASDYVQELERDAPSDPEVPVLNRILLANNVSLLKPIERKANDGKNSNQAVASSVSSETAMPKVLNRPARKTAIATSSMATSSGNGSRTDLVEGYRGLRQKTKRLFGVLLHLQAQHKQHGTPQAGLSVRIQAIIQGQTPSGAVAASPPGKPQVVARAVQMHSEKAMEIVIADLEDSLDFMRGRPYDMSDDSVRDGLVKRMRDVEKALPESLKTYCELGFMHIEHENLKRKYANDQTMLMEAIADIPRPDFYVTEDNYAWDLSELVEAITANGGVMRNPLSKDMFTQKDVRGILTSPHGNSLAALQITQNEMSQGVRPETIVRMDKLADVMLAEQDRTAMKSRKEMDEFQAYVATLPEREQKTIESFRCPAFDRHAGKAYDSTIGQTIRDAKATELCIHKAGDFIKQAAARTTSATLDLAINFQRRRLTTKSAQHAMIFLRFLFPILLLTTSVTSRKGWQTTWPTLETQEGTPAPVQTSAPPRIVYTKPKFEPLPAVQNLSRELCKPCVDFMTNCIGKYYLK
ncbi:uncharacterized protein N0V89_009408 [Didymosphaeria variabile]|uniref:Uncharacterized protein n=1 Tax=Didymosphaeria variabile TaxID=1932322 RepID=A0A9W8XF04_9PLEO|nr:uncharacterized protein N0V89_009408 [Didymosphaeria variabile]KAJ4348036.1 hypothetical protein N0V89_009408 [Didymosphaeria variabile]